MRLAGVKQEPGIFLINDLLAFVLFGESNLKFSGVLLKNHILTGFP